MCCPQVLMSAASEVAEDPERDVDVAKLDERKAREQKDEPLSLKWPETRRKQATFLFLLPISFPLWLTLPDVRNVVSRSACICRTRALSCINQHACLIFPFLL